MDIVVEDALRSRPMNQESINAVPNKAFNTTTVPAAQEPTESTTTHVPQMVGYTSLNAEAEVRHHPEDALIRRGAKRTFEETTDDASTTNTPLRERRKRPKLQ